MLIDRAQRQQPVVVESARLLADRRHLQSGCPCGRRARRRRASGSCGRRCPARSPGCAASGLVASCAVPAGGVAAERRRGGSLAGRCACGTCAAAGVSPAAAKAIAHPISLICTPDSAWNWEARMRARICDGSIGAGFRSLKRRSRCHWADVEGAAPRGLNAVPAMMTDDDILAEFRAADALLEGHFILSSGLRSPQYLQCARVLMDGARAERLARALAAKLPAELRDADRRRRLPGDGRRDHRPRNGPRAGQAGDVPRAAAGRRSSSAAASASSRGTKVLMVEDVVTTGLSSREAIEAVRRRRRRGRSPRPRWSTARPARPISASPSSR